LLLCDLCVLRSLLFSSHLFNFTSSGAAAGFCELPILAQIPADKG
jgi:hypothetical protein